MTWDMPFRATKVCVSFLKSHILECHRLLVLPGLIASVLCKGWLTVVSAASCIFSPKIIVLYLLLLHWWSAQFRVIVSCCHFKLSEIYTTINNLVDSPIRVPWPCKLKTPWEPSSYSLFHYPLSYTPSLFYLPCYIFYIFILFISIIRK